MDAINISDLKEFVHFALTSQDVNNTSIPLSIKDSIQNVYYKDLDALITKLKGLGNEWIDVGMLARTHGQPATPTRVGKEIFVFVERLTIQLNLLKELKYFAKFGGATGGFNAHHVDI